MFCSKRCSFRLATVTVACSGLWLSLWAAEEGQPRKLQVEAVTGEFAGQTADVAEKYKDRPQVILFVSAERWDRPIARYVRKLDQELATGIEEAPQALATAVWLTDDVANSKEYLPKAQQSLGLSHTALTVYPGEKSGPLDWNVDVASALTVIVVKGGKEVGRFAYVSTNDQDVPDAVAALKKKP